MYFMPVSFEMSLMAKHSRRTYQKFNTLEFTYIKLDMYPSLLSPLVKQKYPLPCALTSAEMCVIVEAEIAIKAKVKVFLTPNILL